MFLRFKRILTLILCCVLMLSIFPSALARQASAAEFTSLQSYVSANGENSRGSFVPYILTKIGKAIAKGFDRCIDACNYLLGGIRSMFNKDIEPETPALDGTYILRIMGFEVASITFDGDGYVCTVKGTGSYSGTYTFEDDVVTFEYDGTTVTGEYDSESDTISISDGIFENYPILKSFSSHIVFEREK